MPDAGAQTLNINSSSPSPETKHNCCLFPTLSIFVSYIPYQGLICYLLFCLFIYKRDRHQSQKLQIHTDERNAITAETVGEVLCTFS